VQRVDLGAKPRPAPQLLEKDSIQARPVTMEIEAHEDGYLARVLQPEGSTPAIGSPIALVRPGHEWPVAQAAPPPGDQQ
jgi:hypothetical protein